MKAITPVTILPSTITSGGATEPRSAPSAYAAGTTYAVGDIVKDTSSPVIVYQSRLSGNLANTPSVSPNWWQPIGYVETAWTNGATFALNDTCSYNHRVYQSLGAGNIGHQPDTSPTNWTDIGPTNKYAMFDFVRNTATVAPSPLTVTLTPGQRTPSFAALGIVADSMEVIVTVAGVTVYDRVIPLGTRYGIIDGYTYFFTDFTLLDSIVYNDVPLSASSVITVTFTRAIGNVSIGGFVIGSYLDIGKIQYGAVDDVLNFSSITRDSYGTATLVARRNVPTNKLTVWATKTSVPAIRALREAANAVPIVWSGLDDNTDNYSPSLLLLGIYKQFSINLSYTDVAELTLEIEEI